MKIKLLWSFFVVVAWLLSSMQSVQAEGNAEAGKKKFYTCGGCHAIEGYTNAFPNYHVPKLGGQHDKAVIAALNAYKTGDRIHGNQPQANSMQGNASTLSDKDLEDIAAYVSKKVLSTETNVITGDPAKGKEKSAAVCAGCHGEDGNVQDKDGKVLNQDYPRLAGQYEDYLIKALKDYKKGVRKNLIMGGMAQPLSDEDIKDISAFYASKRGLVTISD